MKPLLYIQAIDLDKMNVKAHEQIITSSLHLGDLYELEEGINKLRSINPNNDILSIVENKWIKVKALKNEARVLFKQMHMKEAIGKINSALMIATASEHFSSLKVDYMIEEKKHHNVSKSLKFNYFFVHLYISVNKYSFRQC